MPQSNQGGSTGNNSTSKQPGDEQRSPQSEKGKAGNTSQGAQGQKGKENIGKGKMNNQKEAANRKSGL